MTDIEALAIAKEESMTPGNITYRCVADIAARPIRWLWPGKIARGKLVLIAGNPGFGKSQITLSLAAIVSTGGQWPVDRAPCEVGSVLIISAEDTPEDTIKPRLMAAGADVSRCYVLDGVTDIDEAGRLFRRSFNLRRDIDGLSQILRQIGDVALVIIDPISAYMAGADANNNAEVRGALSPLADIADQNGTAIVAISHLNKGGSSTDPVTRVTGSLAFVAAARMSYVVAADPEDDSRRLFLPIKNNLGPDSEGLAYRVEGCAVEGIDTSRISWGSGPVTITAYDALNKPLHDEHSSIGEVTDWLKGFLKDGPAVKRDIFAEGKKNGFSERTMHRARERLGLIVEAKGWGKDKSSTWQLPARSAQYRGEF